MADTFEASEKDSTTNVEELASETDENSEMNFEKVRELIRQSRPTVLVLGDMIHYNSQAIYDLTMIANWAAADEEKCRELELAGAAENFKFIAFTLEQAARGLMDVMFRLHMQPELPASLTQDAAKSANGMTYSDYKEVVASENPITFDEDAHPANMLRTMHFNLEKLFGVVSLAGQSALIDGPEPLHDFYLMANANPLIAVAASNVVVTRSYQMGALGPDKWVFLPTDMRKTWHGTNLTRINSDELADKFRLPCSALQVSDIPGVPDDATLPLEAFADGKWARLDDQLVSDYCFKSISEWVKAIK